MAGDGTANEVINGITDFARVRFGMIPTGSGNDLARGLGIQGSPAECLERILACLEDGDNACVTIDLGQVSWEGGAKPAAFCDQLRRGLGRTCLPKMALKSRIKDFLNKIYFGKADLCGADGTGAVYDENLGCGSTLRRRAQKVLQKKYHACRDGCVRRRAAAVSIRTHCGCDGWKAFRVQYLPNFKTACISLLPFLVAGKR